MEEKIEEKKKRSELAKLFLTKKAVLFAEIDEGKNLRECYKRVDIFPTFGHRLMKEFEKMGLIKIEKVYKTKSRISLTEKGVLIRELLREILKSTE